MEQAMDSDHSLPPELKGMVCSQLSARDLKSLRLVKKCWGDAAASALWREVDLDLNEKDTRSLDALLAPGGDGALSHVKVLSVKYPSGEKKAWDIRLTQLLCGMPRDLLTAFSSAHNDIDGRTLGLVLKTQSKLRSLVVRPSNDVPDAYLRSNLDSLTRLVFFVRHNSHSYRDWLRHASNLRYIELRGGWPWPSVDQLSLLNVRRITFVYLNLPDDHEDLRTGLDLGSLQFLRIENCSNVSNFLKGLASIFHGLQTTALSRLIISRNGAIGSGNDEATGSWVDDLAGFLRSFTGLTTLLVSSPTNERLNVRSIVHHGQTLKHLHLDFLNNDDKQCKSNGSHLYSNAELSQLASACAHVEELALSILKVQAAEDLHVPKNFNVKDGAVLDGGFATALAIVAQIPNLNSLQLTHNPFNYLKNHHGRLPHKLPERCASHQNFATEILRLLALSGSSITFLAFKPSLYSKYCRNNTRVDTNGHCYPHYFYSRGEESTTKMNQRKSTQVVAVPVREDNVLDFIRPTLMFELDPPESYCESVKWYQKHKQV